MLSPESRRIINSFNCCRNLKHPETQRNAKPTLIGAVDGGTGTIGSHVAKLILYTSLSLVCISNRNQRCLRKNFLHNNGFSDYFLFCTKRGTFIHEQRSDRSRTIMRTFKKRKKECTLYEYFKKKKNSAKDRLGIHCPVSCMMLKVVNLHQKPRKNRSQRKLELKYQGKYPQNRTKNHSTNPMPFFLARPTEKLYRNGLV